MTFNGGLYLALIAFQFTKLRVFGPFFVSAVSAGFSQTLLPIMTAEIFKDNGWIYERLIYPFSLIFASIISCILLQRTTQTVYLWALLMTSASYTVLTFGKF
jgi:hypothetical protein